MAPVMTCETWCTLVEPFTRDILRSFERGAEVRGPFDGLAELPGDRCQDFPDLRFAACPLGQPLAEVLVPEAEQDRRQVAHEFVESPGLDRAALVVVGPNAVEDGMPELVVDDVGREAGIDGVDIMTRKIIELE